MYDLTLQQRANITYSLPPELTIDTCQIHIDKYDQKEIVQKLDDVCTSNPCLKYKHQILSYINSKTFVSNEHADRVHHISFHNNRNESICTITNNGNNTDYHMGVSL